MENNKAFNDDYNIDERFQQIKEVLIESEKDLFKFMVSHKDMYLVTDSKLADAVGQFTSSDEYNIHFWEEFVNIARQVDDTILNRVIPQIYYPEMLDIIDKKHKFSAYIFTLYATSLSAEPILRFVFENPQIKIITMPPSRLEDTLLVSGLKRLQIPIFVHTINDITEISKYLRKGVFGFYTDFVTPKQFADIFNF